jgi:hypothetical protein
MDWDQGGSDILLGRDPYRGLPVPKTPPPTTIPDDKGGDGDACKAAASGCDGKVKTPDPKLGTAVVPNPIEVPLPTKLGVVAARSLTLSLLGSFLADAASHMPCGGIRQAMHGGAALLDLGGAFEGFSYGVGAGIAAFGATPVIGPIPGFVGVAGGVYLARRGLVDAAPQYLEATRQAGECAP